MEKDFLQNLGGKIGLVEEVDTDENGECVRELVRIRISINITQPLKKILFLKQEGEADIPMPVLYERLPDFCYCCGIIGHQYKECAKYQGQPKEELQYGMWMKAIMLGGNLKKHRGRERWHYAGGKSEDKSESSEHPGPSQQKMQSQENPEDVFGFGSIREGMGQTEELTRAEGMEQVGEQHLMKAVTSTKTKVQIGGEKQNEITGYATVPRDLGTKAGNENAQVQESLKIPQQGMKKAEMNVGPKDSRVQPNSKKWKRQAREKNNEGVTKLGVSAQKRIREEAIRTSPQRKKN